MARNSMNFGFKLSNFGEFAALLHNLPESVESRVMADAVQQATKPLVASIKSKVKVRTGALRNSIAAVVRRYPNNGKIVGIVGPDKAARFLGGRKVIRGGSLLKTDKPSKYAHLVEFGHYSAAEKGKKLSTTKGKTIRKGTLVARTWVPAQPFMRPGIAQGEPLAEAALSAGVAKGMERESKRALAKMKRIKAA